MAKKLYHKLTYKSILDGERHQYMSIAFPSPEAAEREKVLLEKEYEKRWSKYTNEEIIQMYLDGTQMYTSMIGRDYKVEPMMLTML